MKVKVTDLFDSVMRHIAETGDALDFDKSFLNNVLSPLRKSEAPLVNLSAQQVNSLCNDQKFSWPIEVECKKKVGEIYFSSELNRVSVKVPKPKLIPKKLHELFLPIITESRFGGITELKTETRPIILPHKLVDVFDGGTLNFIFSELGRNKGGIEVSCNGSTWQHLFKAIQFVNNMSEDDFLDDEMLRFMSKFGRHKPQPDGILRCPNGTKLTEAQEFEVRYSQNFIDNVFVVFGQLFHEKVICDISSFNVDGKDSLAKLQDHEVVENWFASSNKLIAISNTEFPVREAFNEFVLGDELSRDFYFSFHILGQMIRKEGDKHINDIYDQFLSQHFKLFQSQFVIAASSPHRTLMGKRFPFASGEEWRVNYLDISKNTNPKRDAFWRGVPVMFWHCDTIVTDNEAPLTAVDLVNSFRSNPPASHDLKELKNCTELLFQEAETLKEFFVPPNAFVQVPLGPFVGAYVYEFKRDVFFKWVTADGRFVQVTLWPENHHINFLTIGEYELNEGAFESADELGLIGIPDDLKLYGNILKTIVLISATILRDFWVVDERADVFYVKNNTVKRGSKNKNQPQNIRQNPPVTYIPRRRYSNKINLQRFQSKLNLTERAKHIVRQHFRRGEASAGQRQLAQILGVALPEGHTLVKSHYRGGNDTQRIYRSISAIALASDSLEDDIHDINDLPTWFHFENEVSKINKLMGYELIFKAANYQGDGGVDMRVRKKTSKKVQDILIQAKCWKNTVGPDVVRELLGSMVDNEEAGIELLGAIYTTSRFSQEATALAIKHNIQLIDGDAWGQLSNSYLHNKKS